MLVDQPFAAAPGFERQPAPKFKDAVNLKRLATINGHEANALLAHPEHGFFAAADQGFAHERISAETCDPKHIVIELLFGVGTEIGFSEQLIRQIGHQFFDVIGATKSKPNDAGGKPAVAAILFFRRALEHENFRALLNGSMGRTKCGISRTNNDNIVFRIRHQALPNKLFVNSFKPPSFGATRIAKYHR